MVLSGAFRDCQICARTFYVQPNRLDTAKYCSRACYQKGQMGKDTIEVACMVCGNVRRRPKSHLRYKTYTCSLKCRSIANRLETPKSKKYSNVRKWLARNGKMERCELCGYDEESRILVIHHKNRNRHDNALNNLRCLCPNCHALEHLGNKLSGFDPIFKNSSLTNGASNAPREVGLACGRI